MRLFRLPLLAVGCLAFVLSTPLPLPLWAGIVFQPVEYLPGQADAAADAPDSVKWPREFTQGGYTFTAFQPQVDSWKDDVLQARQAVQVTGGKLEKPAFGSVFLQAKTDTDMTKREVTLTDIKITKADFPTLPAEVSTIIQNKALPPKIVTSLDQLTANLARTQEIDAQKTVKAQGQVPQIIVTEQDPAILVLIGGKPQLRDLEGTSYQYVFNTAWAIVYNPQTKFYSLLTDTQWVGSKDLLAGPWAKTDAPKGLDKAPKDSSIGEALANAKIDTSKPVPAVYVATDQATLLAFKGAPQWTPVPNLQLSYAANIDQPVLKEGDKVYALLSGRWFSTGDLQKGPWQFVDPSQLPADFAQIPAGSPLGDDVLPSVPNTPEAKEAVITAQIPHKAQINNSEAKVNVTYDGDPKFEPITGTTGLERAVNTSYTVIEYQNKYYCCYNAVWFMASAPTGPWGVTADIPSAIYTIPPSSPAYNVTYVKVYESTPTTTTYGYTAGYLGAFIAGGLLVYGLSTLWNDNYYWYGRRYYYPPPYTYGWGYRHYDPYTGVYRGRGSWGGPVYHTTARGAYNPWNGNYGYGHRTTTPYGSWGHGVVGNTYDGRWAEGGYYNNWHRASAGAQGSYGNKAFVSHNKVTGNTVYGGKHGDNYYVGRDGKVYKYDGGNDSWSSYGKNGNWDNVQKPDATQLNKVDRQNLQQNAPEYAKQARDKAANLTPEQRQQAKDRAGNLNRSELQQNAPNYAKKAQDQARNVSPERKQAAQDRVQKPKQQVQRQRPQQSEFQNLQRQHQSRNVGQQRSRDFHSRRSGGGGFERHGGGRRR